MIYDFNYFLWRFRNTLKYLSCKTNSTYKNLLYNRGSQRPQFKWKYLRVFQRLFGLVQSPSARTQCHQTTARKCRNGYHAPREVS